MFLFISSSSFQLNPLRSSPGFSSLRFRRKHPRDGEKLSFEGRKSGEWSVNSMSKNLREGISMFSEDPISCIEFKEEPMECFQPLVEGALQQGSQKKTWSIAIQLMTLHNFVLP